MSENNKKYGEAWRAELMKWRKSEIIDFLKDTLVCNRIHQWHYPSKGELPPSMEKYCGRSEPVLVWLGDNNVEYAQWIEEAKTWGRGICELTGTVIAWKYIELPKERKE